MSNLKNIGYNTNIENNIDSEMLKKHDIARIVAVHRSNYIISNGENNIIAELSGSLQYSSNGSIELPTTGDWVYVDFYDDDSFAIIHGLIPRTTLLKRKTAGRDVGVQLIAANLDVAFIVQSVDFNLNIKRLERYLVMINESNIKPVILLSKCDLASAEKVDEVKTSILQIVPNAEIIAFSSLNGENLNEIKGFLQAGKTYCLLGSSGVGKTTLLNNILGEDKFLTQTVSKKENKGRHTTTSRELTTLDNGAIIIDTPGMRELGSMASDEAVDETFAEITELTKKCKFSDCSHLIEKGCAVLQAIADEEITQDRYNNYMKIKAEADFNAQPKYERKRKNKALTKTIKAKKRKY